MPAQFKDEPVSTALSMPFSVNKDKSDTGVLHILVRPEASRLRSAVRTQLEDDTFDKCVLTGPSGAGKSLLLYLCAMDCLTSENWLILYIANTAQFDGQEDEECARNVLRILIASNRAVFEIYTQHSVLQSIKCLGEQAIRKEVEAKKALRKIHNELFQDVEIPVFVGIDQWNCLQKGISI